MGRAASSATDAAPIGDIHRVAGVIGCESVTMGSAGRAGSSAAAATAAGGVDSDFGSETRCRLPVASKEDSVSVGAPARGRE
jgi:hypothetical protein